jgi:hypothetical protein
MVPERLNGSCYSVRVGRLRWTDSPVLESVADDVRDDLLPCVQVHKDLDALLTVDDVLNAPAFDCTSKQASQIRCNCPEVDGAKYGKVSTRLEPRLGLW